MQLYRSTRLVTYALLMMRNGCGRLLIGCAVMILVGLPWSALAQEPGQKFPDAEDVREVHFRMEGGRIVWMSGRQDINEAMDLFTSLDKDWQYKRKMPYAEYGIELDAGKDKPMVFRFAREGDQAYLGTPVAKGGFYVRDLDISELSALLDFFNCDKSVAYLLPHEGYFKEMIDNALSSDNSRISSKTVDTKAGRKLLESIAKFGRANPQETATLVPLRSLLSLSIEDFVPDWYVVQLEGCGYHCSARMLVSKDGEAMPASPQNCLSLCWDGFGSLDKRENVAEVCEKVLAGSRLGKLVGKASEIPGYSKKPLTKATERQIRPLQETRVDGPPAYTFYVYEYLGGRVWECTLVVKGTEPVWQMHQIAEDIGNAVYIR